MNSQRRSIPTLAAACLALAAAWPASADSGAPAGKTAPPQRSAPMTAAVQKPGRAGVAVAYRIDATPQLNRATPVVLEFDGITDHAGATVRLRPDAGLRLQGSETLTLPQGRRATATVLVVSEREGLAYLNVFVNHGDASSAISIPIQTGTAAPALKATGELKSTPEGDRIITMPVK